MKKNNNKTRRRELLEARFADLAAERNDRIEVPKRLAEDVFETLKAIDQSENPEALIPPVQDKIIELFED